MTSGVPVREVLEQIEARRARAGRAVEKLREEIARLTGQLAAAERALERLEITRETVLDLAAENDAAPAEPLPPGYREVLAVFTRGGNGLHAKDVCRALGGGTEPRHVESMRARLKRLVERGVLTEPDPGLFVLPQPDPPATPEINSS
ncbi:hypothetical protein [Frankia casuarinae]|jgi:DNA-binding FrmR family transcriptional regulator|uniref:Uncharacterized protein n=3 Tax=Frankia TaxID=1854 RepID=Q2J9Y9_FRACC|nr:hypothetical protein [Frankia casuarinae]ABD11410.1 hypothetical protein Francci3_2036 [Frankia casuarinae]ABD11903.1 hypothetical protein Francci3_2539 [Frankia casuarinae]ABD12067.1 hypothetical protein Francci3_2706 [Frankia casuarinae]